MFSSRADGLEDHPEEKQEGTNHEDVAGKAVTTHKDHPSLAGVGGDTEAPRKTPDSQVKPKTHLCVVRSKTQDFIPCR